jgi:hypothetical protein
MESWIEVATASRQVPGTILSLYLVLMAGAALVAVILGLICGDWIVDPLRTGEYSQEYRQHVSERRQARVCLVAALLCYYTPALIIVCNRAGWAAIVPYLRAHIFDGFGCAALFGLTFSRLRWPLVETAASPRAAAPTSRLLALLGRRKAIATAQLSIGTALIAACSAWVADASWLDVLAAGVCTLVPLQTFWQTAVTSFLYSDAHHGRPDK